MAREHFEMKMSFAKGLYDGFQFHLNKGRLSHAAFELHQAIEQCYSCVLLTLTNYSPASHNIKFLRSLAEDQDRQLVEAFTRDQQRERAWFNTLNEAYVKARYSRHFEISEAALIWLGERTAVLVELVAKLCEEYLAGLQRANVVLA